MLEGSSESIFGKPVPFAIDSGIRPSPEGEGDNCTMWTGLLTALRNELYSIEELKVLFGGYAVSAD